MQSEKEFLIEFIELYKSLPCLWKVKSKEYSDRNLKAQAYDILVKKLQTRDPTCNRETVIKKINSLRTSYRKEMKKVIQVENTGAGEGYVHVHVPNLWYYDLLDFLNDQEHSRQTQTDSQVSQDVCDLGYVNIHSTSPGPSRNAIERRDQPSDEPLVRKKVKQLEVERMESRSSQNTTFLASLQKELDSVPEAMMPFTKKLLMEVIMLGQTNNLTSGSHISEHL